MDSRRTLTIGLALVAALAALLAATYWTIYAPDEEPKESVAEAPKGPPQLYCIFIRPTTGQPRVEFLFDIEPAGKELRFEQIHHVDIDGPNKTVKSPPFPDWRFDPSADPATLNSELSVFDNSAAGSHMQKIMIEIYNYRPEISRREWIEAGLKSIYYLNLHGRCQQTRPVTLASTSK